MRQFLVAVIAILGLGTAAEACSVHDHNCTYHGYGTVFNPNITPNTETSATINTVNNNGIDFDNAALLEDGHGPYIATDITTVPNPDTNQPYYGEPNHVSVGQQRVIFNQNNTEAQHSGDNLAASAGGVAGGNTCTPGIVAGSTCESVAITGPIPGTAEDPFIVKQTNYNRNYDNQPDPTTNLTSYATASGNAFLVIDGHETTTQNSYIQIQEPETLTQTKETGTEYTYRFGSRDTAPHAPGVPVFYNLTERQYGTPYSTTSSDGRTRYTWQNYTIDRGTQYIAADGAVRFDQYTPERGRLRIEVERAVQANPSIGVRQILNTFKTYVAANRRCCRIRSVEDSLGESIALDGPHEQTISRPLSHDELVQLQRIAAKAWGSADLDRQGHDLARAA